MKINMKKKIEKTEIKNEFYDLVKPLASDDELNAINKLYSSDLMAKMAAFHPDEPWIQTHTGMRFNPTNPVLDAIVIEDIAHALSMQCRFSGHTSEFYSVAQHCVGVSHVCDSKDAAWGLMHDASEAYLVDIPSPLKRSGTFDVYLKFELQLQNLICKRFDLPETEPESVKKADKILLAMEARDLMAPLRADWTTLVEPLPFTITPLAPNEAKKLFLSRFNELFKPKYD